MTRRVVLIRPEAPPKPAPGQPCNGCGWCCAAEPCPLGALLSGRRDGACRALAWREDEARYLCGVLDEPGRWLPWLPARWAQALARRWIAAGQGCDCDYAADDAATGPGALSPAPPAPRGRPPARP